MKAIVNGISVEGTPQEIAEYERLVSGEVSESCDRWPTKICTKVGGEAVTLRKGSPI